MTYTAVLWILIILITGLAIAFVRYVLPLLKRIDNNLNVMANYHNAMVPEIEMIRQASLMARDHCADIKQLINQKSVGLNGP